MNEIRNRPEPKGSTCGRRKDPFSHGFGVEGEDGFDEDDNCCSYCGSLNPDEFMLRLEAGNVSLTPTDKNYKVYICNNGGEQFKQTYRTDNDRTGDKTKQVWTTRDMSQAKFYFQHLSDEQKTRFVELINSGTVKMDYPGHFYNLPYFICKESDSPLNNIIK